MRRYADDLGRGVKYPFSYKDTVYFCPCDNRAEQEDVSHLKEGEALKIIGFCQTTGVPNIFQDERGNEYRLNPIFWSAKPLNSEGTYTPEEELRVYLRLFHIMATSPEKTQDALRLIYMLNRSRKRLTADFERIPEVEVRKNVETILTKIEKFVSSC